jgi:hypothetical protein
MDNVILDVMSGGDSVGADDITGVKYQRVKLIHGINGTNDGDVSTVNGLPVQVLSIAAGDNNIGNVDIASSALPTGAATETTLNAIGALLTSGISVTVSSGSTVITDGGGSITVDGSVSITGSLPAGTNNIGDVDVLSLPALPTGSNVIGGVTQSGTWNVATVTTLTGITNPVAITDNAGSLTVDAPVGTPVFVRLSDGSSAITTLPVSLASVPSHAVTNAGTFAVQVDGNALTALQLIDDVVATTGSAITAKGNAVCGTDGTNARVLKVDSSGELQVDVLTLPALAAGTNAIGKLAANSGVDIGDVDVTSISAGSNLIGDVGLQGRTTGGLSIFRSIDLDESEEEAKGSAGTLYSIDAMNMTSSVLYLKIYDGTAASVTVGTTTPVLTYVLPTNGDSNGCGMVKNIPQGLAFANGITVAVTTGLADNNTGAPAANAAIVNLGYK